MAINQTVKLMIQFNKQQLTIPINPEEMTITRAAENEDINLVGIGNATRKGDVGLYKITIESFFPAAGTYFYTGVQPATCVNFINTIFNADNKNNNVAKLVTSGLPSNISMYFVIENFEYTYKAGEESDIYYTLELKQYIPYGATVVTKSLSGLAAARASNDKTVISQKPTPAPQPVQKPSPPPPKTYTVVRGDCLWNITKKYTGNGARWNELYNINRGVIGGNPNLIYPGQVLTLPSGW